MNEAVISEEQKGAKILVVDDEPKNVRILQIHLNARGYTVYTAADGLEALETVEKTCQISSCWTSTCPKWMGLKSSSGFDRTRLPNSFQL